jgi:hypothetical protein
MRGIDEIHDVFGGDPWRASEVVRHWKHAYLAGQHLIARR